MKGSPHRRLLAVVFASSAFVVACNALTGSGDFSVLAGSNEGDAGADDAQVDGTVNGGDADAPDVDGAVVVPLVPCDDAGAVCLHAPPVGWIGPVLLYDGPAQTGAPSCHDGAPVYEGRAEPTAPPAGCKECNCGLASGYDCNGVTVRTFNNAGCPSSGVCANVELEVGVCSSIPLSCGRLSTIALGAHAHGGSCHPSGGALFDGGAATWTRRALVCPLTTAVGSCQPDERCVAAPVAPFSGRCIAKIGEDVPCPSADYSDRHVYYESFSDQRSCTPCACDPPDAGCAPGTLKVTPCGAGDSDASVSLNTCGTNVITAARLTGVGIIQANGSCQPTGGQPSGRIQPTGPTTICCAR